MSMALGVTLFMAGIAVFIISGFFGVFTGLLPLSYAGATLGMAIAFIGVIVWGIGFFLYLIH